MKKTIIVLMAMVFVSLSAKANVSVNCNNVDLDLNPEFFDSDAIESAYATATRILERKGYHLVFHPYKTDLNVLYLSIDRTIRQDQMSLRDSYRASAIYSTTSTPGSKKSGLLLFTTPKRKAGLISHFLFHDFLIALFHEMPHCSEIGNYLEDISNLYK